MHPVFCEEDRGRDKIAGKQTCKLPAGYAYRCSNQYGSGHQFPSCQQYANVVCCAGKGSFALSMTRHICWMRSMSSACRCHTGDYSVDFLVVVQYEQRLPESQQLTLSMACPNSSSSEAVDNKIARLLMYGFPLENLHLISDA